MTYTCRPSTANDSKAIALLWSAFAQERESADPTMTIKPQFDFEEYIKNQLTKPLLFCHVLEQEIEGNSQLVGCIIIYFYDEAPPPNLPWELREENERSSVFNYRRVGSVLGLYVQPEHRQTANIQLLIDAALQTADEMCVSDIDILISAEQTGVQAFVKRLGFTKAAVQYTKHFDLSDRTNLPSLHPPHPEIIDTPQIAGAAAIPLREPETNQLVLNPQGEPVFIMPLVDDQGELLKTQNGSPIYPIPLREPQTQTWVFDQQGKLVNCPVLRDDSGQIMEANNIVQFHPPIYQFNQGKIGLKCDENGNYLFAEVERDRTGKILTTPDGIPVFKQI